MSTNEAKKEVVGYGSPPKSKQFKKGQSGNKRGRPKGSRNLPNVVESAFNEQVIVNENGRRKTVTKLEAVFKQLINKAAAGDARATQQVMTVLKTLDEPSESASSTTVREEADRQVVRQIIARIRRADLADAEAAAPVGADGGTAVAFELISDGAALRRSAIDPTKVDADAGHVKETVNE